MTGLIFLLIFGYIVIDVANNIKNNNNKRK